MDADASPASQVIAFWRDAGAAKWFVRNAEFDAELKARFHDFHFAAARRELERWMHNAEGALALLILLDQFPRNVFRGCAHSYATDALARHYAKRAIADGLDVQIEPELRVFSYLPFEHSEDAADQERAVTLLQALGNAEYLRHARMHRDVIARFGRFPHRNRELGRQNTRDEQTWLDAGGRFGG